MSAPRTAKPVLTDQEIALLLKVRSEHPTSSGLKSGGRGSVDKNNFLKCVSKFLMVHALSFYQNPVTATPFDFANGKNDFDKSIIYENLFKKMCLNLLASKDELADHMRVMGMGNTRFQKFWKTYVLDLVTELGGDCEKGIDIMTIMCNTIKTEGNELRFNEWAGGSVKALGDDAINEHKVLEKKFIATLGPDGKPKSGKTWETALDDFRRSLFDEHQEQKRQKKSAKQNSTAGLEKEEALQDVLDPYDKFGEASLNMPNGWLPGGSHAWLVFVCYGSYGRATFDTDSLFILQTQTADTSEAVKTGRRENKQSALKPESASKPQASNTVELVDNLLRESQSIRIQNEFDIMWNDKCQEVEASIQCAKDKMETALNSMKHFEKSDNIYLVLFEDYRKYYQENQALQDEKSKLLATKPHVREEFMKQHPLDEVKPLINKRVKQVRESSNEQTPVQFNLKENEENGS